MKITHTTTRVALGCAVAMLSGSAFAITLGGSNVDYRIDSSLGLFGGANVVGDSLVFTPVLDPNTGKTDFIATGATYYAGGEITITVFAHSGYVLTGFDLSEDGSYTGYNPENAWVVGALKATDIEGNTSNQMTSFISGVTFGGGAGDWAGGAAISLPATGWGGSDGTVTSVTLTLTNDLYAIGTAEIWKTGVSIDAIATPVPEAETYAMMLAGLGLVGFMARRRSISVA
jgi:hypothetical protein